MELESLNSNQIKHQAAVKNAAKLNGTDIEDSKEAFLQVLQGLVGMIGPNPILNNNIPEIKIAKLEVREKEQDADSFNEQDASFEVKKEVIKDDSVKEEKESKGDGNSSKEEVSVEVKSDEGSQKEELKEDAQCENKDINKEQVVEVAKVDQQVVREEVKVVEDNKEVNTSDLNKVAIKAENTAENAQTELASKEEFALEHEVQKVLPKKERQDNTEALLENQPYEAKDLSEESLTQGKETVKILNVKSSKDEQLRSLKDDIEVSYFEAKELMQREVNSQVTNSSENFKPDTFLSKSAQPQEKLMLDLISKAAFKFQGLTELTQGSSINKSGSGFKVSDMQGVMQNAKPLLDKNSSEKLNTEKFSARTAQAQVMVDKVKEVITQAAVNKTNDSITVKVDPPHLGELTVKVSEKKGQLYAKITPESKEVEEILRSHSREISGVMQALGYMEEDVQVTIASPSSDFHNTFSTSEGFQGNSFGSREGFRSPGMMLGQGAKDAGTIIDNNVIKEDLVGWVA